MKVNFFRQVVGITCLLCLISGCNNNAPGTNERSDTTTKGRIDKSRIEIREENIIVDVLEVNADLKTWLKEAANMATDTELKSMAGEMMKDREKMGMDLEAYADKRKFNTDDADTTESVKVSQKQGIEWDEECADEIGDKHRQLIRRLERAQNRVENGELKNLIAQNLPTLRSQTEMVEKLETRLEDKATRVVK